MSHLVNGLPTIGSAWELKESSEILGYVVAVELPDDARPQVTLRIETDRSVVIGLSLEDFLRDWAIPGDTSQCRSKWERLLEDDIL